VQSKSFDLAWIVVKDFKKAIKFYTETVGLKVITMSEEYGWAELQGHNNGAMLGIAVEREESPIKAGQNACVTFTVEDIEKAQESFHRKGAKFLGEIQEVPGHVRMLTGVDVDGNHFQLAQVLDG
jgi:predicted enzyme related to lactoylglutathione lyase